MCRIVLVEHLKQFYEPVTDILTWIVEGNIQVHPDEIGLRRSVRAARLSEGTLHYLCLLAILCYHAPPPLLMVEKPKLGLHPDNLPAVAKLILQVTDTTQLIVTMHSNTLEAALSEHPEVVLVGKKDPAEEGTRLRRQSRGRLTTWLERYPFGEIWRGGDQRKSVVAERQDFAARSKIGGRFTC